MRFKIRLKYSTKQWRKYWYLCIYVFKWLHNVYLFVIVYFRVPESRFFSTLYPKPLFLSAGSSFTLPITFRPLEKVLYEDKIVFYFKVSFVDILQNDTLYFCMNPVDNIEEAAVDIQAKDLFIFLILHNGKEK